MVSYRLKYLFIALFTFSNSQHLNAKSLESEFVGQWTIDVQRTIKNNPSILKPFKADMFHHIENSFRVIFSSEGKFEEAIYKTTLNGVWSKYGRHVALVRLDSDENILAAKTKLKQKAKSDPDRYSRTREYQKLFRINRLSFREYRYLDGNLIQEVDFGDSALLIYLKRIPS